MQVIRGAGWHRTRNSHGMHVKSLLFALVLAIAASSGAQEQPRITRIEFRPATPEEGNGVVIALQGTGRCTYTLSYGDGQSERRTANLPDQVRHAYAADAEYEVTATPEPPCEGVARAKIDVRAIARGIWRLMAEHNAASAPEVMLTVDGRGDCAITVDFGDGQVEKRDVTLPAKLPHKYVKAGAYEIVARTQEPCRGEGRIRVEFKD
jgi:hypothetical protein